MQETREEESQGRRLNNKIHTRDEAGCIVRFREIWMQEQKEGKENLCPGRERRVTRRGGQIHVQ